MKIVSKTNKEATVKISSKEYEILLKKFPKLAQYGHPQWENRPQQMEGEQTIDRQFGNEPPVSLPTNDQLNSSDKNKLRLYEDFANMCIQLEGKGIDVSTFLDKYKNGTNPAREEGVRSANSKTAQYDENNIRDDDGGFGPPDMAPPMSAEQEQYEEGARDNAMHDAYDILMKGDVTVKEFIEFVNNGEYNNPRLPTENSLSRFP